MTPLATIIIRRFNSAALFCSSIGVLLLVFATGANASVWNILPTTQNGVAGTAGDPGGLDPNAPTLGMVFRFTVGINGGGQQLIYGQGIGPGYACYGLVAPTATCADAGTPEIWDSQAVTYTGSLNDDGSFLNLSWTGQAGSAVDFGAVTLFTSSILSGNYDTSGAPSGTDPSMSGYDSDGFSCWNDPLVTLPGPPDFCGNGTGNSFTAPPFFSQTILARALPDGLSQMVDNMDGTISLTMTDSTYSSCVASPTCVPGSGSADVFAQWTVDATNIGELVPDVVGLAQTAAEIAITSNNLTVGVIITNPNPAPAGEVIDQNPGPGSAIPGDVVPAGTAVDLIVSSPLPEIVGGSATGIINQEVTCKSKGKPITIPINGASDSWDCEQAGFDVNPGDKVEMKVIGVAK